MGCDIHLFVEAKKTIDGSARWVNIDRWKINPYYKTDDSEKQLTHVSLYRDRDYSLFSLLAGVRDYSNKTTPVSPPKGLPDDISDITKQEADSWDSDGHTHSWLTLRELKAFQATSPIKHYTGLLSQQQASDLDANGVMPNSWCQGSSDRTMVRREWSMPDESLNRIIVPLTDRMKDEFWLFGDEWDEAIENNIRIVFWFDN